LAKRLCTTVERAKKRFLVDVLAKRGHYQSRIEDIFATEFPGVMAVVRAINNTNHCNLIRLLQRLEALVVVHTIAPMCLSHFAILTLHDAIIAPISRVDEVIEHMQELKYQWDIPLAWKTEPWK
jgi:hypothetical protein